MESHDELQDVRKMLQEKTEILEQTKKDLKEIIEHIGIGITPECLKESIEKCLSRIT